jgi:predicted cobalt transporter CbtA
MLRTLLVYGLLAGLCAGVLAAGAAHLVGEPPLDRAIAWEDARAHASGAPHEHALVSRGVQSTVGLLAGAIVYGVALGGLFALVFAGAFGRISRAGPARTALGLGLAAFVVLYLVPFVKYPANPPAVGDPDTIGSRTALHVAMVAISVLAAVAAVRLRRDLLPRVRADVATALAVASYLVVVICAGLGLPAVDEVPATFPAATLFDFREASVGIQLVLWTTLASVFAVAAERRIAGAPAGSAASAPARGAGLHGRG